MATLTAVLNGISAVLLVSGYKFIRRGDVQRHRQLLLAATTTSALFLASYLTNKFLHGTTYFGGEGLVRSVYRFILATHTVLAAAVVPLVAVTLWRAFGQHWDAHRRIARWALPIWLYVSVTGVLVYLMLRPYY